MPIIETKVDEYKLCDDNKNISPGKEDYNLLITKRSECEGNSTIWIKLD
jgi:hypothetical protein